MRRKDLEICVDLEQFGGNRLYTVEELVTEVIENRRMSFLKNLLPMKTGELSHRYVFDAIAFNAVIDDFGVSFTECECANANYEGTIEYAVTAGEDWTYRLKTTITWRDGLPEAFGWLCFHTDVISTSEHVKKRNSGMTGTSMEIKVINNETKVINRLEALNRTLECANENDN